METGSTNYKKPGRISARAILSFSLLSIIHFSASAQGKTVQAETSSVFSNPLFIALLSMVILLLIVIIVFAEVVKAAAHHRGGQEKAKRITDATGLKTLLIFFTIGCCTNSLFAQTDAVPAITEAQRSYWRLDGFTFYLMLTIISCEVFVAWTLYNISMQLLGVEERRHKEAEERAKVIIKQPSFIEKMNASVAVEEEADIMLDHNYDGIRELDNNLPPWWKYGFYLTIVWAVVYMIHFHVTKTGKLPLAEYEDQLTKAKSDMEEYRKKAANLIDENNATLLTDETSINSGKSIFMDNCAACHGKAGEGGVGPNLTDDYWVHSGGIKDIFKTIKYGWPEKGMKSWQQDLGAKQIHEVASFIKSLNGSNPPNQKDKEGEFYKDETVSDLTKVMSKDSTQIVLKEK